MSMLAASFDIYIRQGDTGNIVVKGIPKDKNYNVYMSVYNPDSNSIIAELLAANFNQAEGIATFTYSEDFSNSLPVGDWGWGLKICANGSEDTLIPKTVVQDGKIVRSPMPAFTVDYKVAEGT